MLRQIEPLLGLLDKAKQKIRDKKEEIDAKILQNNGIILMLEVRYAALAMQLIERCLDADIYYFNRMDKTILSSMNFMDIPAGSTNAEYFKNKIHEMTTTIICNFQNIDERAGNHYLSDFYLAYKSCDRILYGIALDTIRQHWVIFPTEGQTREAEEFLQAQCQLTNMEFAKDIFSELRREYLIDCIQFEDWNGAIMVNSIPSVNILEVIRIYIKNMNMK